MIEPNFHRTWLYRLIVTAVLVIAFGLVALVSILVFLISYRSNGGNVLIATLLTTLAVIAMAIIARMCWEVYRRHSIERPTGDIIRAAHRIASGDFSARFKLHHDWERYDEFDIIGTYINRIAEEMSKNEVIRSDFIADISHEIRTPLSIIAGYAQTLQEPALSPERRRECLDMIIATCSKTSVMVSNILMLNRLEKQKILPKHETFDLSEDLSQCLIERADAIDEKGLELECDIPDRITIKSDRGLLDIIWNNLLSNAIKFTDRGGKIHISLSREGDRIAVRVRDTGCGMTPEIGKRIFDKFYQGDASHRQEGNGLGLSLVKRVIDLLGGDIKVDSKFGEGSEFTVTLRSE